MNENIPISCEQCRFFQKYDHSDTLGSCHRFPPQNISRENDSWSSDFPEVSKKIWCGEFKQNLTLSLTK